VVERQVPPGERVVSLQSIQLASRIEQSDEFHLARLLLLMKACGKRSNKPVEGITKLAKLDFFLRYPNCLVRALHAVGNDKDASSVDDSERNTIEAKMIRFRYGPWDERYRRWIGLMTGRSLASASIRGRTVLVQLTEEGQGLAETLAKLEPYEQLWSRSKVIAKSLGSLSATRIKDFVYEVVPEIVDMKWGEDIDL